MFNIDLPYKSDSFFAFLKSKKGIKSYLPMRNHSSTKAGFKKNCFIFLHFSTSLEMQTSPLRLRSGCEKNYCILRPVLWMQ